MRANNRIKVSLHNHTEYSSYSCVYSKTSPILREAFKQLCESHPGILAITDNNNDVFYRNLQKIIPEGYTIEEYSPRSAIIREDKTGKILYLLHAIEFHEPKGHLLGIGITMSLRPYSDPRDNAKQVRDIGGIVLAAHPLAVPFGGCGKQTLDYLVNNDLIDGIEGFNALCRLRIPFLFDAQKYNDMAKQYAQERGVAAVSCSDSRHPKHIVDGIFLPEVSEIDFSTSEKLIESIRKAIRKTKYPDNYHDRNREKYNKLVNFARTVIFLDKLGRRLPWRKKVKGEILK